MTDILKTNSLPDALLFAEASLRNEYEVKMTPKFDYWGHLDHYEIEICEVSKYD